MPTVFAANESAVLVDGVPIEGVRSVEYRTNTVRNDLYAIGSSERIGVITGQRSVEGRIRVASSAPPLDALVGDKFFQIAAPFRQGSSEVTVSFDECLLTEKSFSMAAGGHGESVYAFTATRVREGG
jgi:hypothetical protein